MGHERLGFLPKTRRWINLVDDIIEFPDNNDIVQDIASNILKNVNLQYDNLEKDKGVLYSFKFLLILSYASSLENPKNFFDSNGIQLNNDYSPYSFVKAVNKWIGDNFDSLEYKSLTKSALIETIIEWHRNNDSKQTNLFEDTGNSFEAWRKTSDGSGFCGLIQSFFSKITEKYLKYFLDRFASIHISNLDERKKLDQSIDNHILDISKHAFETSKITQSFAAGWFNKYATDKLPSDIQIKHFLSKSFGKIKSELIRDNSDNAK